MSIRFRPEIALTRLGLAELLFEHYPDEAAEAQEHLDFAIAEFREELKIAGDDALVLDQLGTQLLEAGRSEEAVPVLESAVRIEPRALAHWDPTAHAFVAEPGAFELLAGASSRDIRARVRFELA